MKKTSRLLKPIESFFRWGEGAQGNSKKSDPLLRSQSEDDIGLSTGPTPSNSQRRKSDVGYPRRSSEVLPGFGDSHSSAPDVDKDKPANPPSGGDGDSSTTPHENEPNALTPILLIINAVKESSDVFPPLKAVSGSLSFILSNIDRTMANSKDVKSLMFQVGDLAKVLNNPAPKGEVWERRRREALGRKLWDAFKRLELLEEQGKIGAFFYNVRNKETLSSLANDIRDALSQYHIQQGQDTFAKTCQLLEAKDEDRLNSMRRAEAAGYLSGGRNGCLEGTREGVLSHINQWLVDEKDHPIFWLHGLAGTGKTTIAQSLAELSSGYGKLGASFFCSRDFEDRRNLKNIFPTLAFQLAYHYLGFQEELLGVLKAKPNVWEESLDSQVEKIIIRPLQATRIPTLIIIDALDECEEKEPASTLLSALSPHMNRIPMVKFFITARPEPPIREGFKQRSLFPITGVLKLHEVDRSTVDKDIKLYLTTHLANIPKTRTEYEFPDVWPSPSDIDALCKKAAGLFIYASTVIKFVSPEYYDPTESLQTIISHPQGATHEGELDNLYSEILRLAFRNLPQNSQEPYTRFRSVVGTVLLVSHPLSGKALLDLVKNCKTKNCITATLRHLHSLLLVPGGEDDPICIFHKSFPDFLTDRNRCSDEHFFIDPSPHHEDILFSCLDLMKRRLKKNICDLDDCAVLGEVEDLFTRRKSHIESSLEYSCRFWTRHLTVIVDKQPNAKLLQEAIEEFFTVRLLCWIEVLSIIGHLGVAVRAINDVRQWCISAKITAFQKLDDAERFILENFDMIRDCPSHIYRSALPLSPSTSWLRDCYHKEIHQEFEVLMGLPNKWDTCSRTISIEEKPSAFACWENTIAVGLGSESLLLDAITGSRKSVFSVHTDTIRSLAFSLDGTLLVSGSDDGTVRLWNVKTGGITSTLSDGTSSISSVSISPDNTTIASGTWDGTVHLWDVRTGTRHSIEIHHDDEVTAVDFSPIIGSRRFISSSVGGIVQQWDVDGKRIGNTCWEGAGLMHVAYAPDGTRFISCGGTVAKVRDSESLVVVADLRVPNPLLQFQHCCFSSDGRHIACAAGSVIYVWDITEPEVRLVGNLVGHSQYITSIAFSPSLISGSEDQSVRIWQSGGFLSNSTTSNTPTVLASAPIESVKLFTEENTVVTSDSSGLVRTWDLKTGECKSSFSTPAKGIRDTHLAGGILTIVWRSDGDQEYHILDSGGGQPRTVHSSLDKLLDLKISGDGSRIFGLGDRLIEARLIQTGKYAGHVRYKGSYVGEGPLVVDGVEVWLAGSKDVGWDFGGPEVSPFSLSGDRLRLRFTDPLTQYSSKPALIQDTLTGEQVFRLPERYMGLGTKRRWDGRYLVICPSSGEVLIMDFNSCVIARGSQTSPLLRASSM